MKRTFTLVFVSLIGFAGYSQKTTFGIKGAVTTNYLRFTDKEIDWHKEGQKTGFYVGGVANIPLVNHLAFQPNLLLVMKGGDVPEASITTWNIEIPLNLVYTYAGFFVGAGPNLSYGLDGRAKSDLEPDGELDIYSKGESPEYTFKRFEIGANVLMGYTFSNGVSLSANFAHGFNNLYDGALSYKNKIHSKTFGFSAGYMFGSKK